MYICCCYSTWVKCTKLIEISVTLDKLCGDVNTPVHAWGPIQCDADPWGQDGGHADAAGDGESSRWNSGPERKVGNPER